LKGGPGNCSNPCLCQVNKKQNSVGRREEKRGKGKNLVTGAGFGKGPLAARREERGKKTLGCKKKKPPQESVVTGKGWGREGVVLL